MLLPRTTLNCRGRLLTLEEPIIFAILNITDNSFYAPSRNNSFDNIVDKVGAMIQEGASVIDVGGMSSRPGAKIIEEIEEIDKIIPVIESIKANFPDIFISIDGFRAKVVESAFQAGVDIINDISGLQFDAELMPLLAKLKLPYILMHNNATFDQMHHVEESKDKVLEVFDYFTMKINELNEIGIFDIILDPGFGFGKTLKENFALLHNLGFYKILNLPIMVGVSRKSFIQKTLHIPIEETLNATTVLHSWALSQGASILRVHDIKEAKQCIELFNAIKSNV